MVEIIAKWVIIVFGIFIVSVGLIMLLKPSKAREILRRAGSTNFINYAEITLRMLPAVALILAADISKYPQAFKVVGWFMLCTSLVLYFVPRQVHYNFANKAADILKPLYFRLVAPFALLMGVLIIYSLA